MNNYKKPSQPPIAMVYDPLPECIFLERFAFTFTNNMTWTKYIEVMSKAASVCPRIKYCHNWAGASASSLFLLDRVTKRVANPIRLELSTKLTPLSHRQNLASFCPFYKYFNGKCSDKLCSSTFRLYCKKHWWTHNPACVPLISLSSEFYFH